MTCPTHGPGLLLSQAPKASKAPVERAPEKRVDPHDAVARTPWSAVAACNLTCHSRVVISHCIYQSLVSYFFDLTCSRNNRSRVVTDGHKRFGNIHP